MSNRIGRLTLGASLLIVGIGLLASNLTTFNVGWLLSRAWPIILIALGFEWIAISRRLPNHEKVRIDGAAIAVLVILAMVASISGESYRVVYSPSAMNWAPVPIQHVPPVLNFPIRPTRIIAPGGNFTREVIVTHELNAAIVNAIDVSQTSGSIVVDSGPIFRAEMRVVAVGRTSDLALELAESVRLVVTPGPVMTFRTEGAGNAEISLHITLPEGIDVRAKTSSGPLRVKNISANVTAEASSGSVLVEQSGGEVQATSSSGSIQIVGVKGGVRANSSSGSITVRNSENSVSLQASSGRIAVEAASVNGPIDLTAASGSVSVVLPTDANVNIRARSSSGIVSGPPWLVIGEGRNSGTASLGAGEQLVRVNTGSGSITLGMR